MNNKQKIMTGFTLIEMLVVMTIIAMAYALIMPRLSFDVRQKKPQIITAIQQAQDEAKQKSYTFMVYATKQAIIFKHPQKKTEIIVKKYEKLTFPDISEIDGESRHLLSIINSDGTMKPATIIYRCGNNQYTITMTAFNGIQYQGIATDDEPLEECQQSPQ